MVEIKVGNTYECPDLRSGQGGKGEWAFFRLKAKKGYDQITVWASNAGSIAGATAVKVLSIDNVKMSAKLNEKTNQWYKNFDVTAKLERAESGRQGAGSGFLPESEDEINALFGL